MEKLKVTYVKGYPSLKTMQSAWRNYDDRLRFYMKDNYKYSHAINWQDSYTQDKIDGFAAYLLDNGIRTGTIRDWDSPCTGKLEILPKL